MPARGRSARGGRGRRIVTRDAPRREAATDERRDEPEAAATRTRPKSQREIINELLFLIKDEFKTTPSGDLIKKRGLTSPYQELIQAEEN
ncbi:hypothetical protein MY11210_009694 [Beauveria gryllotalpidicola]